jgi:DNA-binding NarL/FixJ family response regulator
VTSIRVLLVDDHALVRAGIRSLLEQEEALEVVGETGDGREALELIEKLRPDIVLLDLTMPGLSGFEVLTMSKERFPAVQVIIITIHDEEEYAFHAFRSGAAGYLPKTAALAELRLAIDHVMNGKKYLSPGIAQKAAAEFGQQGKEGQKTVANLTPRQREVLILIAEGRSTKEIARELNISVKTVESHRGQLMDRLNIHDIAGLVRYAIKFGLASVEHSSPSVRRTN